MPHVLFRAWNSVKGYLGFTPDPRPDPEDAITYAHAAKIQALQKTKNYPEQIWPGKGSRGKSDVDALPSGLDDYQVDVYTAPAGDGYQITYFVTRGGKNFYKVINEGPETFREWDWSPVPDVKMP